MTNNATSETVKATGDSRVAAQTAYDNSKTPHTTHSDVAKSIHQVKDAGVQAHKVSDDAKYEVQKSAHDEAKATVTTPHKEAGVTTHTPSHTPKVDAHKAAHDEAKVTVTAPHKEAGVTTHNPSQNPKSNIHEAAPGVKVGAHTVGPAMNKK